MVKRSIPPKAARRYRGFILDADNTLFDFDRAEREALAGALQAAGCPLCPPETVERYHRINAELWRRFEQGTIGQEELRIERFRLLLGWLESGRCPEAPSDPRQLSDAYIEHLSQKGFLLPHAAAVLRLLSARAHLVLLSNGIASVQRRRISNSGIGVFFRDIIISTEVGIAKPHPEIFRLALDRLELAPGTVLCVGDSPASDIRGGSNAGLDTCWYAEPGAEYPPDEPLPDYRIGDLRELLCFVGSEG